MKYNTKTIRTFNDLKQIIRKLEAKSLVAYSNKKVTSDIFHEFLEVEKFINYLLGTGGFDQSTVEILRNYKKLVNDIKISIVDNYIVFNS